MLFVFGKRAKKLRLNKVSELIHKSDGVKDNPPTSARVSVFFQEIIALPQDEDFWVYFFQEARKWGLAVYNQDWQDFQIVLMK